MSVITLEFLRAAALGDINRMRALLAQGVDINSTNKANQTALMLAAAFNRADIVKFLLTAGANVNCHDDLGLTASDWAHQQSEIVALIDSSERLHTSASSEPTKSIPLASAPTSIRDENSTDLESVILRANKRYARTVSPQLAATAAATAPVSAEPVRVDNEATLDSSKRSRTADTEPQENFARQPAKPSRVDIELPQPQLTMSPAMRTLFRVSVVVFVLVAGFVSYHLLTRRTSNPQPGPIPVPVRGAAKPTKSAPVLGGELAGAELFLPDAEFPPEATVESGVVTVGIQVSRKGIVVSAKPLAGDESLRGAAVKAAKSSAFAPDQLQGKSSLISGTITYNFLRTNDNNQHGLDSGFTADSTPTQVLATAGGPLVGAERQLEIPPVPTKLKVRKEAVTVVVRVNRAGRVVSWRPLNVDKRLRAWVIRGARASTFDPAKLPGERDLVGIITYTFQ
jgi:hypothetical protein